MHTWQQDLRQCFKSYLDCYLTDKNAVTNIFGEDYQAPTDIPFFFKITKVRSQNATATAIVVHIGKYHHANATKLLEKPPFEDVEMVVTSNKQKKPALFDKQLQLHNRLCQRSTAVKLRYTSETFHSAL